MIKIPKYVQLIMNLLDNAGYESYIVGGCVRDSLLGLVPKDWDICTNALSKYTVELFEDQGYKVVPTGLKHGTVTIIIDSMAIEVTTFRIDGEYTDCRNPECVSFTNSLKEDLSRRDFTINAIAYNKELGLVDYFNGKKDLEDGLINTVGSSNERFSEDALRMLRAVRLSTKLSFDIGIKTAKSIFKNRKLIKNISAERIREELVKILMSDNPSRGIELFRSLGLLEIILPELQLCYGFDQHNPNHNKDVYFHILEVLKNSPNRLEVRLAALLHDIGKPNTFSIDDNGIGHFYKHHLESEEIARQILTRLRFDNKTINNVSILVREHMSRYDFLRTKNIKKFISRVGIENLDDLFELQIADIKGLALREGIDKVKKLRFECERVINENHPLSVKDLKINGYDLMSLGVPQGKDIGEILKQLLEIVLDRPETNNKEELLKIAKQYYEKAIK